MRPLITLLAATCMLLAAGGARAMTIENKTDAPAAVTIVFDGRSQTVRLAANSRETIPCSGQCQVRYKGARISATDDDNLVISADGRLLKSEMR